MSSSLEYVEAAKIKGAVEKVLASRGFATGSSIFNRIRAAGNEIVYSDLEQEYGTPNIHLGGFCKAVTRELGVSNSEPYALFDRKSSPDGLRMIIKPVVVAALST